MLLQTTKVLVLNASYEPLSICDARNAVLLLFCGKAMMVASHPEHRIRTVTESYPLPSIVRLTVFVQVEYRSTALSRKNLFRRDGFRCQYCGGKEAELTLDHVIPKSRGGEESWENLVTACKPCNSKKGNRTPAEADMTLLKKPSRPSHITLMRQHYLPVSDEWKPYLFMS
ncbi:HNH endonuclease [Chlorobaculum limnaeum]|uniref:HNH endonuclease n=1 Tax=Chlorobaculum limnaeum TaxID=274537 RepID=A0A1D8D2Y3_CHLLM|nr:HNH endonuclease [Chlorobaculum limnaeum]AOS83995.1 HNH endonuclease [Chlorobaculum limnaeum]